MKAKLACLSLAAFAFASCDKGGKTTGSDSTSSNKPQVENRVSTPTKTEKSAHGASSPTAGHPANPATTRPAGTAPAEASSEPLTPEQMVAKFNSDGIAGVPKDVAEKIIRNSSRAGTQEEQARYITEQAEAWRHINTFSERSNDIPDHMKRALIERLVRKHGDSWKDMATELDEQVAASAKVMEFRLNGIPGMSPDESNDLIVQEMGKYGPDYKTILSIALERAKK